MQQNTIDLTGMTFGKWTVLRYATRAGDNHSGAMWLCRCACKNETVVRGANLRRGSSTQCRNCAWEANRFSKTQARDLTGQQFGKWQVIERALNIKCGRTIVVMWKCRCDGCGRESNVQSGNLTSGRSTQCKSCAARAAHERKQAKEAAR